MLQIEAVKGELQDKEKQLQLTQEELHHAQDQLQHAQEQITLCSQSQIFFIQVKCSHNYSLQRILQIIDSLYKWLTFLLKGLQIHVYLPRVKQFYTIITPSSLCKVVSSSHGSLLLLSSKCLLLSTILAFSMHACSGYYRHVVEPPISKGCKEDCTKWQLQFT